MTSAFIIDIKPRLQPDRGEETAELLRIPIQAVKDPTSNGIPPFPQWTGPPSTIVQDQNILCSSLATTLFSAFLAMLDKQWLNRYASVDMRGFAIERSQYRQRKLNGVFSWYFDVAMESPTHGPIGALSRYLWSIDHSIACVILGFTSFGVLFYLSILAAGSTYKSCPYQTLGSQIIRYIRKCIAGSTRTRVIAYIGRATNLRLWSTLPWHGSWYYSLGRTVNVEATGEKCPDGHCVLYFIP